jgi:transcriptional regulator with XRE-family HTH domain
MGKITFIEWLAEIMKSKGKSKADLARSSGLSPAQITRITTGEQGPGIDTIVALARALDIPATEVFKKAAGLIDQPNEKTLTEATIDELLGKFSKDEQEEFLESLQMKWRRKEKKQEDTQAEKKTSRVNKAPARIVNRHIEQK